MYYDLDPLADSSRMNLGEDPAETGPLHRSSAAGPADAGWRLDLEQPIPLDLPVDEQLDRLRRHSYFSEVGEPVAEQFGFATPAQMRDCRLMMMMTPDLPGTIPALTGLVAAQYELKNWQMEIQNLSGERKVLLCDVSAGIVDGQLQCLRGVLKDVRESVRLSEDIHLCSEIFEHIPEGCIIVGAAPGDAVYLNPAFTDITGYRLADVHDPLLSFLQGPDTDVDVRNRLREAIKLRRPFTGRILSYKKDGTPFWSLIRLLLFRDNSGEVTHCVAILSDVTAGGSRKAHREPQRTRRLTAMDELTAALAHELNQPLTAILSNAQAAQRFLKRDAADIDNVQQILGDIVTDGKRAAQVMRRMRQLVKTGEIHLERLQIAPLLQETSTLLAGELELHQAVLSVSAGSELPELQGDPVQLQQVMINLIANACQALDQGSLDSREIRLAASLHSGRSIEIEVADTGPGIAEDKLEKIFQPFFSAKADGMGMGLWISRMIVEAHGGRLWAESRPGQGAVFRMRLPVER